MDDFNKTPNIYPNLDEIPSNEEQFRLKNINEIKDYFLAEIGERELISKNLSKKRFVKKFLKTIRNKKKKDDKIVMLDRSKLNGIESKTSKALMDNEISHEYFEVIINEEKNIEN